MTPRFFVLCFFYFVKDFVFGVIRVQKLKKGLFKQKYDILTIDFDENYQQNETLAPSFTIFVGSNSGIPTTTDIEGTIRSINDNNILDFQIEGNELPF